MAPLPIDRALPALARALDDCGAAVLVAEPGAGKTTRVPPWLLDRVDGEVWVVQPRRMAAVLAAGRVADERGEPPGRTVGWSVRFDEVGSRATRLWYATDGVFLRRLLADPGLTGIGAVVLDELHERRLATDLALGLAQRVRVRRGLQVVAMSATLDPGPVAAFLGGAPVVRCEGRTHAVAVQFAPAPDARPLEVRVRTAVRELFEAGLGPRAEGADVLVFLPGAAEIQRCAVALAALADEHGYDLASLHGAMDIAAQQRALAPGPRPRAILATNLAETSVTLPRVAAVVDSGLHRRAGFASWSGLPTLQLTTISQAAAVQRAGRAGRVRPGRCSRLYTQHEHDGWPAFDAPEIARADLADVALLLAALDLDGTARDDVWLTPPPPGALARAHCLLARLGALDAQARLTALGRQMLRLPVHPRLARLALAAAKRGVAADGARVVALLADGARLPQRAPGDLAHGYSDLAMLADSRAPEHGRSEVRRTEAQLLRLLGPTHGPAPAAADRDAALAYAALLAYPDRVARRRQPRGAELQMAGGVAVRLDAASHVTEAVWLVVLDAEERRDARGLTTLARVACGIEADWLLEAFASTVEATTTLAWDDAHGRVDEVDRLVWEGLVLNETRRPAPPTAAASAVLAHAVRANGTGALWPESARKTLRGRLAVLGTASQTAPPAGLDDVRADAIVISACEAKTRLSELAGSDWCGRALHDLDPSGQLRRRLDVEAPVHVRLPGGRSVALCYDPDKPPWLATRIQDLFGLADGPSVGAGRVPVVLHLLSPAGRPVQITSDLAGFWKRHWPTLRRELQRRYPKHAWPEDPCQATPRLPGNNR
ncbi:MAG: ATP-dependent helicase HrpB [Myxococcales bacterium]|nr:ATP-dependent helicase HrpB [Myxococcales bacterium]